MEILQGFEHDLATAHHYLSIGRYEEAERYVHSILEYEPLDAAALFLKATILFETEKYSEARGFFEQALVNGHTEEDCYHLIGLTYQYEDNLKEAEKAYLHALRLNPENADIHASYGYLMLWAGLNDKGLLLLEEASKLDPTSARVNHIMLHYYFARSDEKMQHLHIQSMMEHGNDESMKLFNLALFHIMKDEDKQAREYLVQAFLLNPTDINLLEILQEYDMRTHSLFLPQRLFQKLGGPAVVWIASIAIFMILRFLKLELAAIIFIIIYISLAGFTWLAPSLYKWFVKGRV